MELNWLESIIFGLLSGLGEILPVSARAHGILLLKIFGAEDNSHLFYLLVHLAILAAVYISCLNQIVRYLRARSISRIPKKKRKRPLDTRSLMDFRMLRTMAIPVILAFVFYGRCQGIGQKAVWLSVLLFLNGVILYVPQFLPGSNKDSRTLTRLEGLLMGLGGAASVLPGLSGVGASLSIGSVCGVDRTYALNMTLLMEIVVLVGLIVYDIIGIISVGLGTLSFLILIKYLLSAAAAFAGAYLGIRILRALADEAGFSVFAYYCWGAALFAFILNLLA